MHANVHVYLREEEFVVFMPIICNDQIAELAFFLSNWHSCDSFGITDFGKSIFFIDFTHCVKPNRVHQPEQEKSQVVISENQQQDSQRPAWLTFSTECGM